MTIDADLLALKATMQVRSDGALANALHVGKSAVSMWRRRGVPEYAKHRARMMAQHGQIAQGDSLEKITSQIALLSDRLSDQRINLHKLADDLEQLAARARAIGGDA